MKLKYTFVANEIGGRFIAVPVGDSTTKFNGFIKLNETARFVLEQLGEEISKDELVARIKAHFSCSDEDALANADYMIKGLTEAGLLTE